MREKILSAIILFFIILFAFWDLPKTFYQQDEWLGLGQILAQGWHHIANGFSPIELLFGEGKPLTRVLGVLIFGNFPFNSLALSIYDVFFHFINAVLVFFIAHRLLKNSYAAFVAASFFSINSVSHQSVSWFGGAFGLLPASTLIFLSLFMFILFLQEDKRKYLYFSFLFAFVSFYFREHGLFLILFFPIAHVMLGKRNSYKSYLKAYSPILFYAVLFVAFRFFSLTHTVGKLAIFTSPLFITESHHNILGSILLNGFFYPLTSLSLIFVPPLRFLSFAENFAGIYYPFIKTSPLSALVSQTIVLDLLATVGSILLLTIFWLISKKGGNLKTTITFSLLLFILSLLPYSIINKSYSYLEPRYYYIAAAAAGLLLATVVSFFLTMFKQKTLTKMVLGIFLIIFFTVHINTIRNDIASQVILASERKNFLNQLLQLKPTLTASKNIFYITSDKDFIVKNNKVPFQHGFGYSLLVLYYKSGKIPKELLSQGYLWSLTDQGYKEIDGLGFGYFWDYYEAKRILKKNKLPSDSLTALYYHSGQMKLSNITEE